MGSQLFSLQLIYTRNYLMCSLLQINIGVFIAHRLHPGTLCGSGNTAVSKKTQALSSRSSLVCVML